MTESDRLAQDGGRANRLRMEPRTANPYPRGSALFDLWDTAWCDEDDRLREVLASVIDNQFN